MNIELKNISKIFNKKGENIIALNKFNKTFKPGKFYAIMGSSGSGKSTLLNIIGLLDKPTSGLLYIDEISTLKLNESEKNDIRFKKIGYVFQDFFLSDNLNVYENIMLPLLINKSLNKQEKNKIVCELIKMVGLQNRKNHFTKELSGGERQRVSIARSLVNNPSIILADEPTGNLDLQNEKIIFTLLKKLSNLGKCVIIVSHSSEIVKYADEIIYIKKGCLVK